MHAHVVPVIVRTERLNRARNRARLELAALRLSRILGARYVRAEGLVPAPVRLTEVLQVDDGRHVVFRSHVEGTPPRPCSRCRGNGLCPCPYCASDCHVCAGTGVTA